MCIASMYMYIYIYNLKNQLIVLHVKTLNWNQFFHVWHRMQMGPRRLSLALVVAHGSAQEWTLLVRNSASSFTTLSWNLSKSCKLKFPLFFLQLLLYIMFLASLWALPTPQRIFTVASYHELFNLVSNCISHTLSLNISVSQLRYRSYGRSKWKFSLFGSDHIYALQIVLRVELQIAVSIFRSHSSPISSWPFVLRYWNHLSPQKLAYETSRMVALHTSWITHIKVFW